MGVVYKAEDTKLKRLVALKFLPPDLTRDEEAKERFIQEAQTASSLDHLNICTIYEIDETQDGQMFIAMAYYEGETLKKKVSSNQLSVNSTIEIAIQMAQGLAKAHQHDIVHRDVKPANVILTNEGVVKIIDFGLAKLAGAKGITKTPSTMGTVAYMSPEQTQDETVDHRTDIWSLGVVLYEMLTGQLPFKGGYDQAVIYSIMNEDPKPIAALRSSLPIALAQIVEKALQKDRSERYQRMDEFIVDLRHLKGEPTPPEILLPPRVTKTPKKKSWALALSGLILVAAILALLGYFFWPQSQEEVVERIPVAVADFVNETKEEELDGLSGMLITALEQSRRLSVLTRSRMFDVLKQMGKENVDRIDETLGREICQRANVKTLVVASIRKFGKLYTIDLKIIDLDKNEHLFVTNETGEGQESIPAMIDKLSEETRAEFKERAAEIRATSRKVAEVTTINLDAYQHYFRGEDFINKLLFAEAEKEFKQAIAIDSTFGLAYYRLAYVLYWRSGSEQIARGSERRRVALQKAFALSERIPEKEKYLLSGLYAKSEKGFAAEIVVLREMAQHYPNDKEMLYQLGDDFYHIGKYDSAVAYLEKVLTMDPAFERALQHLVRTYADLGQYEKMLPAARKFQMLNEREGNYFIGEYYYHVGDYKTALAYMEKMLAVPFNDWTFRRAVPYAAAAYMKTGQFQRIADYLERHSAEIPDLSNLLLSAYIQFQNLPQADKLLFEAEKYFSISAAANWPSAFFSPYFGKYRRSIEVFDEMEESGWQANDTARVVDVKIFKALYFLWGWNDFAKAWVEFEKALQYPAHIPYWKNVAILYAYRGEYDKAESVAAQKESAEMQQFVRVFIHSGMLECADARAIADSLFPSQPEHIRTWALYPLAQCQFETGQYEAALASLREIQKSIDNAGGFHAVYYPKSFYLLGKIYEKKGDKKLAIKNYEKLLELWKDADQDLPELIDAKARLAKLHGA